MTDTNTNEHQDQPETEPRTPPAPGLDHTIEELESIGRAWATHGLQIGSAALHTSAATLTTVAGLLGNMASTFATQRNLRHEETTGDSEELV